MEDGKGEEFSSEVPENGWLCVRAQVLLELRHFCVVCSFLLLELCFRGRCIE